MATAGPLATGTVPVIAIAMPNVNIVIKKPKNPVTTHT